MNKILVSTLCWKRPQVFDAFCDHFKNKHKAKHILVAGSQGDECTDIVRKHEVRYTVADNRRLGYKANESIRLAKGLDYDYILLTGSDDFMSAKMWDFYSNYQGDYLCLKDLYFYHTPTKRTIYWKGYEGSRAGQPIGAFQLIKREVVEAMEHTLFDEKLSYPCEVSVFKKASKLGVQIDALKMGATGGMAVDIKTGENLTKFNLWANAKYVNYSQTLQTSDVLHNVIEGLLGISQ
jgi:hypothetical protein